jgi:zinc/manganese transport system substrate-binding protein
MSSVIGVLVYRLKMRTVPILVAAAVATGALLSACGPSAPASGPSGFVEVAAVENVWGSIAAQIGGEHVHVVSVVSNPDTDPHSYEPTPQDARAIADAQYVILNGAGYDAWAQKLVDANGAAPGRITMSVADLAGRKQGDNPHMWYSPAIVMRVVAQIGSDLDQLDPADQGYFSSRLFQFTSGALAGYDQLRSAIHTRYAGTPVGATESVFVDLAADLGLDLRTPSAFMKAVSEGEDPAAQDRSTVDAQISGHQIRVLVVNSQNSTPDVQRLIDAAGAAHIPVVPVTETLTPATATFQDWQVAQLTALQKALVQAST